METSASPKKVNKENKQEHLAVLRRVVILLLLLFLCVYMVSLILTASDFFLESAQSNALNRLDTDLEETGRLIDQHYINLQRVADKMASVTNQEEAEAIMDTYIGSTEFGNLRFYVGTKAYAANGVEVEDEVANGITELAKERKQGGVIFFDSTMQQDCIAFFLPVKSGSYVDGVLSIVPITDRETGSKILDLGSVRDEDCEAIMLIGPGDRVMLFSKAEAFIPLGNNVQSFLADFTVQKEDSAAIISAVQGRDRYAVSVSSINGGQYCISCAPLTDLGSDAVLVQVFNNDNLVQNEMVFIRHIIVLLAVTVCAFIGILVYSILYSKQSKKAISRAVLTDATIECPNAEQFRRDAIEVLYAGRMQPYAIMYCKIKRYNVIVDMLGEQKANEIFSFVANVFEAFCNEGETYGYVGDGEYLMMIRYRNEKQIGDKITLLEAVINKSDLVRKSGVSVKFAVGVYLTAQNRRATVPQMIEGASLAAQTVKKNAVKSYSIYTEEVDREIANNERIEARMEESLASGEFKLFMQPKYNVKHDRIDSAEALVRWFDPSIGDYRFPGDFISLFESNGFIIKLDHFIYLEVLKYMQAAAERGEKIVPVSVNVSRVTALQDNFIEFYVQNKRDHQIGDGFITLEITESFAMESDEKLLDIVNRLHENGIRCSIDDFGSGYSSYNTIKQIPIDEIKIDRIFLAKGLDQERDDKIIMSVVQLAKDLGVEVVQEGVETEAMFNRVVEMGCEVIQGYYYAKAIPIEEYRIFINSNTSIQFKKKVK